MNILIAADVSQSYLNEAEKTSSADLSQAENNWFDIEQLANLVPLDGAKINLIYVKEELPSYERVLATQANLPQDMANAIETQAKPVLNALAKKLDQLGAKVQVEIVTGPPAYMIEQAALDEKKDLVVVSSGPRDDNQFMMGSTSAHVARHAPCSTLVLRKSKHLSGTQASQTNGIENVLVAIDGSDNCLQAVEAAMKNLNGKIQNKKIHLIYVASVSTMVAAMTPRSFSVQMEENLMMEGEVFLATAKKVLSEHGFKNIEIVLKTGVPAHEVIKAAADVNAQLIVIGAQGKGAIKHFLMGEVANKIVTHAPVATLVARGSL